MPLTELWLSKVSRNWSPALERVRLAHELQRVGGVGGEDDAVLLGRRVEEAEHARARALDELGGERGRRVGRVRVAEDAAAHELHVMAHLRVGVHAAAGVVQVHVPVLVEPEVLGRPQHVELRRVGVAGKRAQELRVAVTDRWLRPPSRGLAASASAGAGSVGGTSGCVSGVGMGSFSRIADWASRRMRAAMASSSGKTSATPILPPRDTSWPPPASATAGNPARRCSIDGRIHEITEQACDVPRWARWAPRCTSAHEERTTKNAKITKTDRDGWAPGAV